MSVDFPCTIPLRQVSLKPCKQKPHHGKWIVGCYHDDGFELAVCVLSNKGKLVATTRTPRENYEHFWDTIASLRLARGKWWLVGWRTRYALELAGLLRALEAGAISLPESRSEESPDKPGGKVTLSLTNVEVDLVVGKKKIKVLDYMQFGMTLEQMGVSALNLTLADCERTLCDYLSMCSHVGLSMSRTTAAQIGWARCRARHLPATLCVNLDDDARELERRAHYPGRNECFKLGDIPGKTYGVDIKSCYAWICATREMPVYLDKEHPVGLPVGEMRGGPHVHWFADVVIRTESPDYPVRFGGQVIYPAGEFFTTLAWPELQHAQARDRIVKVTRAARYVALRPLMDYALWFSEAKRILDDAQMSHMAKSLKAIFNASLGYTARHRYDWKEWTTHPHFRWWIGITDHPEHTEPVAQARVLNGRPEYLSVSGEPYEATPYLHATICSWARVRLLEIFDIAGRDNVLYCDTDGLLVTAEGFDKLQTDGRCTGSLPGQLAERFAPGRCRIRGQKNYRIGNRFVCAGGIETRRSLMADCDMLVTSTGRADTHGNVEPFRLACVDEGDGKQRYVNHMA